MSGIEKLKNLLSLDTDTKKPKKLTFKNGQLTAQGIAYNRKLLKQGRTNINLTDKLFNPELNQGQGGFTSKAFDKRNGKIKKSFLKKNEVFQGVFVTKDNNKIIYKNPKENEVSFKGLKGNYRIIVKKDGEIIFDRSLNIGKNFWKLNVTNFILPGSKDGSIRFLWDDGDEGNTYVIITKEQYLPTQFYQQSYKLGMSNCVLTPILKWFNDKLETCKGKGAIENLKTYIKKFNDTTPKDIRTKPKIGYFNRFIKGLKDCDIEEICNGLKIGIEIRQPLTSKKYYSFRPNKNPQKVFSFINAEFNHVELDNSKNAMNVIGYDSVFSTFDPIKITQEELNEKFLELEKNKIQMITKKHPYGLSQISTLTELYTLQNDFYETISIFEEEQLLKWCAIDGLKEIKEQDFINDAIHFNGTTDFKNTDHLRELGKEDTPPDNLEHIDMEAAYTKFYECKYYKGFLGKITDYRETVKIVGIGFYLIEDLDLSNCSPEFKQINNRLNWFMSSNIYTNAELEALTNHGAKYQITKGLWGNSLDFRFTEDMYKKEEIKLNNGKILKIPYYAKWTGVCASLNSTHNSFFMKGKENENLLSNIDRKDLKVFTCGDGEYRIEYNKNTMYNKKHITAYITAYQRLIMLDQLLKMDYDKLVRICVDGIYYEKHNYENIEQIKNKSDPVFRMKTEMTFKNTETEDYLSNLIYDTYKYDKVVGIKFKESTAEEEYMKSKFIPIDEIPTPETFMEKWIKL